MRFSFRATISSTIFALTMGAALTTASAEEVLLKGQSVTIGRVYWIRNCQSILKQITGIYPSGTPAGLTLSLQKQNVTTSQCGGSVPGALVVAKASKTLAPGAYSFTYVVTYKTEDGNHSSNHSKTITVQ